MNVSSSSLSHSTNIIDHQWIAIVLGEPGNTLKSRVPRVLSGYWRGFTQRDELNRPACSFYTLFYMLTTYGPMVATRHRVGKTRAPCDSYIGIVAVLTCLEAFDSSVYSHYLLCYSTLGLTAESIFAPFFSLLQLRFS